MSLACRLAAVMAKDGVATATRMWRIIAVHPLLHKELELFARWRLDMRRRLARVRFHPNRVPRIRKTCSVGDSAPCNHSHECVIRRALFYGVISGIDLADVTGKWTQIPLGSAWDSGSCGSGVSPATSGTQTPSNRNPKSFDTRLSMTRLGLSTVGVRGNGRARAPTADHPVTPSNPSTNRRWHITLHWHTNASVSKSLGHLVPRVVAP